MGDDIVAAWHSLAPGSGRGGSTWTSEKHNGGDQVKIPPGKSDGGGNVDALIGPTLRADPATSNMDQFFLGAEMVIAAEEKTHVIENVISFSVELTEVKVKEVKDTVLQSKYHNQYEVTLENGRDTIIQTQNKQPVDERD